MKKIIILNLTTLVIVFLTHTSDFESNIGLMTGSGKLKSSLSSYKKPTIPSAHIAKSEQSKPRIYGTELDPRHYQWSLRRKELERKKQLTETQPSFVQRFLNWLDPEIHRQNLEKRLAERNTEYKDQIAKIEAGERYDSTKTSKLIDERHELRTQLNEQTWGPDSAITGEHREHYKVMPYWSHRTPLRKKIIKPTLENITDPTLEARRAVTKATQGSEYAGGNPGILSTYRLEYGSPAYKIFKPSEPESYWQSWKDKWNSFWGKK